MTIAPRLFYTEKQMHFVGKHLWSGVEQYRVSGTQTDTTDWETAFSWLAYRVVQNDNKFSFKLDFVQSMFRFLALRKAILQSVLISIALF